MMRGILVAALILQVAAGMLWTLSMVMMTSGGLEIVAMFVVIFAVQLLGLLIGAWAYWQHADLRQYAGWLLALPVLFLFLPSLLRRLAGGPVDAGVLFVMLLALLLAIIVACLAMPGRMGHIVPQGLYRSRLWNGLLLAGPLLGLLLLVAGLTWLLGVNGDETRRALKTDATGVGLGSAIVIAAVYATCFGAYSLLIATWAWLGLHSDVEDACRKLNVAQLVVALPGVLLGAFALFLFTSQH